MNQKERRQYLIDKLIKEQPRHGNLTVPRSKIDQKRLLRSLMNVRMPGEIDGQFLAVQDEYLKEELAERGVTDLGSLEDLAAVNPALKGIYLWQGDITTLRCGAIVNAANSGMTGCYVPCHGCIDNCIHSFAGIQLRMDCARLMAAQGHEEETGRAKITPAYNLPCDYVIHTVGPIITGGVTGRDRQLLASCYRSCLKLAEESRVKSLAFCCISTGEFHFPNEEAAEIAVKTVMDYRRETNSHMEVIFNVFKEIDREIYRNLLEGFR